MNVNYETTPPIFDTLPPEIKIELIFNLDIIDIEKTVRALSREWRALASDFMLWKGIADRIGYDIPKDLSSDLFYENVKNHIITIQEETVKFPETLKGLGVGGDAKAASDRIALSGAKLTLANIKEVKRRIEKIKAEDTIKIWKAIQKELPALRYPTLEGLNSEAQVLDVAQTFAAWVEENSDQLSELQQLDLSSTGVSSFPEVLSQLTNLQKLDLGLNYLRNLPEWIGKLNKLRELKVDNNQLSSLPESIGDLSLLENLQAQNNIQWLTLPDSMGRLTQLRKLDLSFSRIARIPESLKRLPQLEIQLQGVVRFYTPESRCIIN